MMIDYSDEEEVLLAVSAMKSQADWSRRRAAWASLVAAAFVAGLAIGLLCGWSGGYRDFAAHAIAQQVRLIGRCHDGLAVTVWTERGPKDSCIFGSNRMSHSGD